MLQYWQEYRSQRSGTEGLNQMAYRFAAPSENLFKTFVSRADYGLSGAHRSSQVNVMRDHVEAARSFQVSLQPRRSRSQLGIAVGHDWVLARRA